MVRTPIVDTLDICGLPCKIHAVSLGMVQLCNNADTPDKQLAAVGYIVDEVCELPPEEAGPPSEIFGLEDCNRIVAAATGTAKTEEAKADFPTP